MRTEDDMGEAGEELEDPELRNDPLASLDLAAFVAGQVRQLRDYTIGLRLPRCAY